MANLETLQFNLSSTRQKESTAERALQCREILLEAVNEVYAQLDVEVPQRASLLELIDSSVMDAYLSDPDISSALHFIRILGMNAKHGKKVKKKEAELAVDNTEYFLKYVEAKQNGIALAAKPVYMSESETRKFYIDKYLEEAGWEVLETKGVQVAGKASIEIEVDGMPNGKGLGYCDYVLYGRDGKPLAIVEAKKTSVDPVKGRHQVDLYGDCMEAVYGYKPILYYTNGYVTKVMDGIYPDRVVSGFHSIDELELMLQRRNRGDIVDITINDNITNRPYQKIAITKLCEHFNNKRRRGLFVMATGTGKTRVAISMVDILARNNWVKNVLFLADRTALVNQAKGAFDSLMPDMSICELSGSGDKDMNARLMFSTYQTMINYIDAEDKKFSIGRFDLIIIDEAHRSVFNKYGSIFTYFDSLLVGLTATPKEEVDANTYALFGCESGIPNFDYSLEDAVSEKYLVPYKVLNKTTSLYKHGAKYKELSKREKEQLEEYVEEKGETPDVVATRPELYKKLYNKDTCRKIIEDVMSYGIKVNGGETIGKTIIFAYNHNHAKLIVDCFQEMYPQLDKNYCQLVDTYINYADDLVLEFGTDDEFRIAVSVDMLDTGVDVPAITNLVFFKPVKSKIKFMQMIGRGTRLCENLFGPGEDKTHFLIFDYCGNFEYFEPNPDGADPKQTYSLSQGIFDAKLENLYELQALTYQQNPYTKAYYDKLKSALINQVKSIKNHTERIQVRGEMAYVDKYSNSTVWDALSAVMVVELQHHITRLIDSGISDNYKVLSFDYRMLKIQNAILKTGNIGEAASSVRRVRQLAKYLIKEKASVPQVIEKIDDLKTLSSESFWIDPSFEDTEEIRKSVRNLMQFVDTSSGAWIVDIKDKSMDADVSGDKFGLIDIRTYRERVVDYLFENSSSPVIKKIQQLEKLNTDDLDELQQILWYDLGTREEYDKIAESDNVAVFIRSLVGLDQTVVNKKFGEYLSGNMFNSQQQEFIRTIINYVRENGDITKEDLLGTSPFDDYDLLDLFDDKVSAVVDVVSVFHDSVSVTQ